MIKIILLSLFVITINSCTNAQTSDTIAIKLSSTEFAQKIADLSQGVLIDVRTPDEFNLEHLENAININWNSNEFTKQISVIDKTKPVYIYCGSGGRSTAALNKMLELGFIEIYELRGGITSWKEANLPLVSGD